MLTGVEVSEEPTEEPIEEPSKEELMGQPLSSEEAAFIKEKVEECSARLREARDEIAKEVWGQDNIIELTVACMVAGGHLLAVGVPGVAKTRLVSRVATVMGLEWNRVQFTPDLMPSDILGSEVQDPTSESKVKFIKGPAFTQFLMADEINRAGPRTQAALLEAMQEKKVTVAGETHILKRPFTVMATQNPLEQEGTYPLPEAQMDRFLMKVDVHYPTEEAERRVMRDTTGTSDNIKELFERSESGEDLTIAADKDDKIGVKPVLGQNDLILMQKLAKRLPLDEEVVDAAIKIVHRARPDNEDASDMIKNSVAWGPGPRALQAFASVAKARALMDGRSAPDVGDILAVVKPVLEHRMDLNFQAKADGVTFDKVIKDITMDI
jgi:MoxR-like ATPase